MLRHFQLCPSLWLAGLLTGAHGAALAVLLVLGLPFWAKPALTVLVVLNLFYLLLRNAWLSLPASCVGLLPDAPGKVILLRRDGARQPCQILRDSTVTPHLTVLSVRPEGARLARSVVILPDSMDPESFRRLRIWLKWGGHVAP